MKKAIRKWEEFLRNCGYEFNLIEKGCSTYYIYAIEVLGVDLICGIDSELRLTLSFGENDYKSVTLLASQWINYLQVLEINA